MIRIPVLFIAFLLSILPIHAEQLFMVVTPEKTGTHLLTKAITLLTNKECRNNWQHTLSSQALFAELETAKQNNQFLQMHALPTPEIITLLQHHGYKVIFLMRDPRDVLVSLFFYIEKGWRYGPFRQDWGWGRLAPDAKLAEMITGAKYKCQAINEVIVRRLPWMRQKPGFVYTVRFENLVGPNGGGTTELQHMELVNIANHLGLELNTEKLGYVAANIYGQPGERTFREGKIGSWRKHLVPSNILLFKKCHGFLLIKLGYEQHLSW